MPTFQHFGSLPGDDDPNQPAGQITWERLDDGRLAAKVSIPHIPVPTFAIALLDIAADHIAQYMCAEMRHLAPIVGALSDQLKAHMIYAHRELTPLPPEADPRG